MSLTKTDIVDPDVGEFALSEPAPVVATPPYTLPPALDWAAIEQNFCDIDFVFPGLTAGGLGMLAAPGGTGKSYMLLALAASIAMGKPLLEGWPQNEPAKVLIFFAEDPGDIIHNRLRYLLQSKWVDHSNKALLMNNLIVRSMVGEKCVLTQQSQSDKEWYRTEFAQAVEKEATAFNARLVLLDPLRQFHVMEENDSGEMTDLLKTMHGMAHRSKAAFVFAHHTNKNSATQGGGDAQQAARGSSAITDNIRWQGNMVVMQEDEAKLYGVAPDDRKNYVRLSLAKANYTNTRPDIWFERAVGGILVPVDLTPVMIKPNQELDFLGKASNKTTISSSNNRDV